MIDLLKKIYFIYIIIFLISVRFAYSQSFLHSTVSVTAQAEKIKNILNDISVETGVTFSFNPEQIPVDSVITIQETDKTLEEVLERMFSSSTFEIKEIEGVIVVAPINHYSDNSSIHIKGTVAYEKTREPIPYSSIYIKNEPLGTISNEKGTFDLEVPSNYADDTLIISSLGYKQFTCPVNYFLVDNNVLVLMKDSVYIIDESQVIAYNHVTDVFVEQNNGKAVYVLSFVTEHYTNVVNFIKNVSLSYRKPRVRKNIVLWNNIEIEGIPVKNIGVKLKYSNCTRCPFQSDVFVSIEIKKRKSNLLFDLDRREVLISKFQNILNLTLAQGVDIDQLIIKSGKAYIRGVDKPYTGPCFSYYKAGNKAMTGYYNLGKREGLWYWWFQNGQLGKKVTYSNAQLNFTSSFWYKNGNKKIELNYKNGKKNGMLNYWYSNGQLRLSANFTDDKLDGLYEFWFDNGQPAKKAVYKNGAVISAIEWNKNGKVIKRFRHSE